MIKLNLDQKDEIAKIVNSCLPIPDELINVGFEETPEGVLQEIGIDWSSGHTLGAVNYDEEYSQPGDNGEGAVFVWGGVAKDASTFRRFMKRIRTQVNQIIIPNYR